MKHLLILAFICSVLSYLLVRLIMFRSHAVGLIDRPNERSLHTVPTPRGGGVAFVVTFTLAAIALYVFHPSDPRRTFEWWLVPSASLIAILGFLDDRFSLRASQRLVVQSIATVACLAVLFWQLPSDSPYLALSTLSITGVLIALFSFFWMIWMTNLYNFMDGIDGYAALQAVIVSIGLAAISFLHEEKGFATLYMILGAAVVGFLIPNWSPARIFMGDAGSTFLGFFFAAFAVAMKLDNQMPFEVTIIAMGMFIVDATYTLLVRLANGKKAHIAHRTHAYQNAVKRGWSHRKTVLLSACITVFWLLPIATAISASRSTNGAAWLLRFGILLVAFIPLVIIQVCFRAGTERHSS